MYDVVWRPLQSILDHLNFFIQFCFSVLVLCSLRVIGQLSHAYMYKPTSFSCNSDPVVVTLSSIVSTLL